MDHEIDIADPADAGKLSETIAEAFHDLPQAQWLISDDADRSKVFPGYFRILVDHALTAGTVYTFAGGLAAALWLPVPADGPSPPAENYTTRLAEVTGPYRDRFTAFDITLDQHHPTGTAHAHLAILAVHPTLQGLGIGTALLRAHHTALDQAGIPAYLEASTRRTCALYLRHGYTLQPSAQFCLPGDGPPMFAMVRPPPRASG